MTQFNAITIVLALVFSFLLLDKCHCASSIYISEQDNDDTNQLGKNSTMLMVYNLLKNEGNNICKRGNSLTMKVKDKSVHLNFGFIMTYSEGEGIFLSDCSYYQLNGHNVSEPGYIKLPDNISELNDYMCGPMNRKGFLCEDCIDGYGPSASSIGYKCSKCTGVWYGVPLYLLLELVPVTFFYFIILIFPIPITYAPMTCFIMYSQLVMFEIVIDREPPINQLVITQMESNYNGILFKGFAVVYGIWSQEFFNYLMPPFCISENFRLIHVALLGGISVVYQIILIIVTWICIELHGRNFKLIVWLWRPFSHCFGKLRRKWDSKSDIIDFFSAFFLISYSSLIYQMGIFLECSCITNLSEEGNITYEHALVYDPSADCIGVDDSTKSFSIAILAVVSTMLFYILLVLLLILYPIKLFRKCMSKCKLDRLSVTTFIEKFHGCYRDGLDGGRDMRSFSGFYFILRLLPFTYIGLGIHKLNLHLNVWSYTAFLFFISTLLTSYIKPYKHNYMNILDTLLLANTTILCYLLSRDYADDESTVIEILTALLTPTIIFALYLVYKVFQHSFLSKRISRCWKFCWSKIKISIHIDTTTYNRDDYDEPNQIQPLLAPTVSVIDIGTYDGDEQYTM